MYTKDDIEVRTSADGKRTALVTKDGKYCTQPLGGPRKDDADFQYWYRINEDRTTTRIWNHAGYDYVFPCEGGILSACKRLNEHLS